MIFKIKDEEKIKIDKYYDLTIILAATLNVKKYIERFLFLVNIGIFNTTNKKISVISLLGMEEIPDEVSNICLISTIDFYFVNSNIYFPSNSTKLASFFVKYEKINCKYILKIDEDSITDITGIYTKLDEYGHFEYLTTTQLMRDCDDTFVKPFILKNNIKLETPYVHEWECCATTVEAVKKVTNSESAMMLMNQFYNNMFNTCGDHVWAPGFLIAKVNIKPCDFISCFFDVQDFPKTFKHIHYAAPDYPYCKNSRCITESIEAKIKCIRLFGNENSHIVNSTLDGKSITLVRENEILFCGSFNNIINKFSSYEIFNGNILIYDNQKKIIIVLADTNESDFFKGFSLYLEPKKVFMIVR